MRFQFEEQARSEVADQPHAEINITGGNPLIVSANPRQPSP
jgi:hypothetical protein